MSNHIQTYNANLKITMQTQKTNATTIKQLFANKTITERHMRHIFMPVNKPIKK